jgi:hypothetical protein
MASVSGLLILLKKGDGASPEEFTAFCSISAKTINFDGQENTSEALNCDDPSAIAWLESEMQSKRVLIEGNGTLNAADFDEFYDWWDGGESANCQVVIDVAAAAGGRILEGGFKLPKFSLTGNKGEKAQVSISLGSDGPVTKTNNT